MEVLDQQQRVREVLSNAVTSLCKKILKYQFGIRVEGLLGITVDTKNIVLVNIQEDVQGPGMGPELPPGLMDSRDLDINADNAAFLEKLLGRPGGTDQFSSDVWNEDVKVPENVLSELLDKVQADKCDLFVEEPKKAKPKKKKKKRKEEVPIKEETTNPVSSTLECLDNVKADEEMDSLPLLGCEESPRGKGLNQSLRYFDDRDTLLSLDHDDNSLDCFPPSLASPSTLDCNGHLDMEDATLKTTSDLYDKSKDMSSVKEETNDGTGLSLMSKEAENSLNSFIPSILEGDITDSSSMTTDGEKFPCNFCGVLFSHKRSLWRHLRKHKGANTSWKCDVCSQTFSRKDILLRHKNHHKTKSEKCPFCNKTFSRLDSIQRHISISHNDKLSSELPPLGLLTGAL